MITPKSLPSEFVRVDSANPLGFDLWKSNPCEKDIPFAIRYAETQIIQYDIAVADSRMRHFWQGRPKNKPLPDIKYYIFDGEKSFLAQQRFVKVGNFTGKDWTGML